MKDRDTGKIGVTNRAAVAVEFVEGRIDDDLQISSEGFHPVRSTLDNRFYHDLSAMRAGAFRGSSNHLRLKVAPHQKRKRNTGGGATLSACTYRREIRSRDVFPMTAFGRQRRAASAASFYRPDLDQPPPPDLPLGLVKLRLIKNA
jgi:hypothetical protein